MKIIIYHLFYKNILIYNNVRYKYDNTEKYNFVIFCNTCNPWSVYQTIEWAK